MPSQGGMTVLPQFQGDYYQLQNQQALAQALMSQAMQNRAPQQTVGSGQYQVMPKMSPLTGMSQLAEAYLGAKMGQNVASGYRDLGANQWAAFNGTPSPSSQSPQSTTPNPFASDQGGASAGSSQAGSPSVGAPMAAPQAAPTAQSGSSGMNPLGLPAGLAYSAYAADPAKYAEIQAQAYKPTDFSLMLRQAGIPPDSALGRSLMQQQIAKQNYQAPTSIRGQFYSDQQGIHSLPAPAPDGFQQTPNGQGGWQVTSQQGGPEAVAASATAKASGPATFNNQPVWDKTANNGQGGFTLQPATNVSAAAGGYSPPGVPNGVPGFTPFQNAIRNVESNGRAAAVNPASGAAGSMQVTSTGAGSSNPGFGVRPAANNSPQELQRVGADYANAMQNKYGNDTDAAVAYNWGPQNADKWVAAGRPWKMLPQETQSYVGQVHAQMQNFAQNPQGAQAGPMASQPPLGQTTAANASQGAPSKLMADSYGSMSTADASYQQSREALTQMIQLANNKGAGGAAIGVLPSQIGTKISPDAAEYQKLHATFVSQQGKALGSGGTDASRANIDESVPTYDKPQSAMISGLNTQLNNLDLAHLKTQYLTPTYKSGDEKAYTTQSAAFDQNMVPAMVPLLTMPAGPQRAAALKQAIANPQMKSRLDWAVQNGLLK